jgi:hypothetical protein
MNDIINTFDKAKKLEAESNNQQVLLLEKIIETEELKSLLAEFKEENKVLDIENKYLMEANETFSNQDEDLAYLQGGIEDADGKINKIKEKSKKDLAAAKHKLEKQIKLTESARKNNGALIRENRLFADSLFNKDRIISGMLISIDTTAEYTAAITSMIDEISSTIDNVFVGEVRQKFNEELENSVKSMPGIGDKKAAKIIHIVEDMVKGLTSLSDHDCLNKSVMQKTVIAVNEHSVGILKDGSSRTIKSIRDEQAMR